MFIFQKTEWFHFNFKKVSTPVAIPKLNLVSESDDTETWFWSQTNRYLFLLKTLIWYEYYFRKNKNPMWRIMHIMIYVDKWNLSVVGLNLQKKNPLTSICFPINYAKHVQSCTFLVGIYSAIYTGRVARQYSICWLKKELSMVHGTLHKFFKNKTFVSSLWDTL